MLSLLSLPMLLSAALLPTAQAADVDWKVLRQTEVQATSFLQSNWNKYSENYHPNYVADDNPATAWVEGVSGNGEGQTILLPTSPIKQARAVRLRIRNGYQKSEGLLKANSAPKDVRITILAAGREVTHTTVALDRKMGWQDVVMPLPAGAGLSAVSLQVDSVHPGTKYKDTCISDIVVEVDTDVPYRPAIEAARMQHLVIWAQDRKKTASYFANLPAAYPFAATAFTQKDHTSGNDTEDDKLLLALEAQAEAASQKGTWWKRTAKGAPAKTPDQLWRLNDLLPLFTPAQLAWFETDDHYAQKKREDYDYGYTQSHHTNARVTFHGGNTATPASIWYEVHFEGEERGPYRTTSQFFAKCDEQGRPVEALVRVVRSDEMGPNKELSRLEFRWNSQGQVEHVDLTLRHEVLEGGYLDEDQERVSFTRMSFTPNS